MSKVKFILALTLALSMKGQVISGGGGGSGPPFASPVVITSTTCPQLSLAYDPTHLLTECISSAGNDTITSTGIIVLIPAANVGSQVSIGQNLIRLGDTAGNLHSTFVNIDDNNQKITLSPSNTSACVGVLTSTCAGVALKVNGTVDATLVSQGGIQDATVGANCPTAGRVWYTSATGGQATCSANLTFDGSNTLSVKSSSVQVLTMFGGVTNGIASTFAGVVNGAMDWHSTGDFTLYNGNFGNHIITALSGGPLGFGVNNTSPTSLTASILDRTASTGVTFVPIGWDNNGHTSATTTRATVVEGASQGSAEVFSVLANDHSTKRIDLTNNIFSVTSTLNVVGSSFTWNGKTCTLVGTTPSCS